MLALHFFIAQSSSPRRVGVVKKSAESDVNAADGMKENEEEGGDEEGENETRAERSRKVMATRIRCGDRTADGIFRAATETPALLCIST
jgi:hypothetical protein